MDILSTKRTRTHGKARERAGLAISGTLTIRGITRSRFHRKETVSSKYSNVRTNGYASKREANVAANLQILHSAGKILDLKEQVHIVLIPGKGKLKGITYVADFTYNDPDGTLHVLDAKGFQTAVYKLKKKMLKLLHDIDIEEV